MKRTFFDPVTLGILVIGGAALSAIGQVQQGNAAKARAESDADFLELEAIQEEKAQRRDLRDLRKTRSRTLARSRAILAAQGTDLASGNALAILRGQTIEFAEQERRLLDDSEVRAGSFRTRAVNERAFGLAARNAAIFSAGGTLFRGFATSGLGAGVTAPVSNRGPGSSGSGFLTFGGPR